jgi:uncharacterized membrane protein YcgQ (UPF0703/DUF1980 family)
MPSLKGDFDALAGGMNAYGTVGGLVVKAKQASSQIQNQVVSEQAQLYFGQLHLQAQAQQAQAQVQNQAPNGQTQQAAPPAQAQPRP